MNEKAKILEMLNEGKITAEEAEKLLNAVSEAKSSESQKQKQAKIMPSGNPAKGKIKIDVVSSDGDNVKISVPLKLVKAIDKMLPQNVALELEEEGINLKELLLNLDESMEDLDDDLVNVVSSEGDTVRIYIER